MLAIDTLRVNISGSQEREYPEDTPVSEVLKDWQSPDGLPALVARVDGTIADLCVPLLRDCEVGPLTFAHVAGRRAYGLSLTVLLIRAARELFPDRKLEVDHAFGQGLFCEFEGIQGFGEEDVQALAKRMRELVKQDEPFLREEVSRLEALTVLEQNGRQDALGLYRNLKRDTIELRKFGPLVDVFVGPLVPSAGYLKVFDLAPYPPGFVLLFPAQENPAKVAPLVQRKRLFAIIHEHERWVKILGVRDAGEMNDLVARGEANELVMIAEALHEKKVAQIADAITSREPRPKILLIAGPSSSGKTTFSKRLSIQLRVNGLRPVPISVDNYFVDREKTPKDPEGKYDYEALQALDVETLNRNLLGLLAGREVEIPRFEFHEGKRLAKGEPLQIGKESLLVIEGIHALNDKLTPAIPSGMKYRIYVSALTQMKLDDHNHIATSDVRLFRRLVRDYLYRGYSGQETLSRWPSVRRGEEQNVFPYQENADVMFNSALVYELAVLKSQVELLLRAIPRAAEEAAESERLLDILFYFLSAPADPVPSNSILREFIGGSGFHY